MRIQHNISALNTYRQMGTNNTGAAKSLEKLSSGYKINRAGDDAAGLAISEKMRAQINGLNRASANAQDGISLIQAAEGALQETESILQRMRELGVQAANDVNETEDRKAIQDEINQLKTEIDRIAYTTEFNKKTLLDGSLTNNGFATKLLSGTAVVAGAHMDQSYAENTVGGGIAVDGVYTVSVTQAGAYQKDTATFDLTGLQSGDTLAIDIDFDNSARTGGQVMSAVPVFTYTATGDAEVDNSAFVNGLKKALSEVVGDYEVTSTGNSITFTAKGIGSGYSTVTLNATAGTNVGTATNEVTMTEITAAQDAEIDIVLNSFDGQTTGSWQVDTDPANTFYINGVFNDSEIGNGSGLVFQIGDLTKETSSILEVKSGRELTLQVGANTGRDQAIGLAIQSLSASGLGIDNLDVSNHISAQGSVDSIESAIQRVNDQRAALGAVQNRLEHTTANLDTVSENLQDAESRIRDVDMAKEMMEYSKFNILQQAAQAMMAQANSQPQGVLQLLR